MPASKIVLMAVFIATSLVSAQEPKYPYKLYDDRKEGIVKERQLVAGEKLVLISAAIVSDKNLPPAGPHSYSLGFYLPSASRLNVVLREYSKSYKLELLQKDYEPGAFRYSWPAEVPQYYNIDLRDLHALVKVSEAGSQRIVPPVLFVDQPDPKQVKYSFCFLPYQKISAVEFNIYPAESLEPIYSGSIKSLEAEKQFYLEWPGTDNKNTLAQSGIYSLVATATFTPRPGTPALTVTSKYQFYHTPDFFKILMRGK